MEIHRWSCSRDCFVSAQHLVSKITTNHYMPVSLQLYEESLIDASGHYPGDPTDTFWQFVAPDGLRSTLNWISERYRRPEVWVTENGVASPGEATTSRRDLLRDMYRLDFYR